MTTTNRTFQIKYNNNKEVGKGQSKIKEEREKSLSLIIEIIKINFEIIDEFKRSFEIKSKK